MNIQTQESTICQTPSPSLVDWPEQPYTETGTDHVAHRHQLHGRVCGWICGPVLIFLGCLLFLESLSFLSLQNWWAIFILVPALGMYAIAWRLYQDASQFTPGVVGALTGALIFTNLSLMILLNIAMGLFWPVLLIVGGFLLLISTFWPNQAAMS